MIAQIGSLLLNVAFILIFVILLFYAVSSYKGNNRLEKAAGWLWGIKGILILGTSVALIYLIMTHQFQYYYVWNYTSLDLETQYLFSAFYGGQEGSFLLWTLFSTLVGFGLIAWTRKPYKAPVMFVMALTQLFLLSMIVGWDLGMFKIGASPFRTIAQEMPNAPFIQANPNFTPADGSGLNDLLKSPWMMIHPPIIFLGFSLMTVPFAFAIASLWTRKYHEWIRPALPWTLGANLCLLTAIFLGGYWAYETLSFGGYWAWDPVENASLVPWLVGTAGIHAMIIQRKSQRAHKAALFFAILAYIFIIYQVFLTRSGVLADQSVHSFVDLGLYNQLLIFILVIAGMGIGFYLYRYRDLPTPETESKILSKEFFTFTGAILLFILGLVIIIGTSSPILGKLFVPNPTPPEISFYNSWSMPLAIIIALATVIGQYLFWEKHDWESLAGSLVMPLILTSIVTILSIVLGDVRDLYYMIYLFAGWFAVIGNGTALIKLIRKNPALTGGAVTHIGFGVLLIGILASSVYTEPLLDELVRNHNQRVMAGEVFDEEGFPVTQGIELFQLEINKPSLINDKYMVTYEGYELSDSPRLGQQTYTLKFEPVDGSPAFYMYPIVYPMLTTLGPDNIEWSVEPHVRSGLLSDIYLYVSGSQYVERQNENYLKRNRAAGLQPVSDSEEGAEDEIQKIELKSGESVQSGPFTISFKNFVPASAESVPENTQIGIRALLNIEHEPSGTIYEVEPLFAVYTENGESFTYSPPLHVEQWNFDVQFTSIIPDADAIEISIAGLDEDFEEEWIVVVAEQKPFVSVVWLGTFMLMAGFSISIMRHWKREKRASDKYKLENAKAES